MLVNLMGETLGDVLANEQTAALSMQIQILADFAFMIHLREEPKKFFFVARRINK